MTRLIINVPVGNFPPGKKIKVNGETTDLTGVDILDYHGVKELVDPIGTRSEDNENRLNKHEAQLSDLRAKFGDALHKALDALPNELVSHLLQQPEALEQIATALAETMNDSTIAPLKAEIQSLRAEQEATQNSLDALLKRVDALEA